MLPCVRSDDLGPSAVHPEKFLTRADLKQASTGVWRWLLIAAALGGAGNGICAAAERLRSEASAFLKASVESPVDWAPWGDEAFARAKREQKPVFVAIGAFTNELSGAMRRQTFARRETADFLNGSFVCVLVDREEHPELAALFQMYVSKVKQGSGWPLNIWLTPELEPFEGAAYLPPSEEWGKPGFLKVAQQARQAWTSDAASCRARAAEAVALLRNPGGVRPPVAVDAEQVSVKLAAAAKAWRERFDGVNGGFGEPPKNSEPELLRFLLTQSPADRDAALLTLRAVARSALRDPLDGGFFRSASDAAWNVPSLQKTLVDQARLALAYLDAAGKAPTGRDADEFREVARGALDYALARLARPDGSFAAAEDATAEESSTYFLWTAAEIDALLGQEAKAFMAAHGVAPGGNVPAEADVSGQFSGKNLLRSSFPAERPAIERLRSARERRAPPLLDDRGTAGAHGLLLAALARASRELNEPRYAEAAKRLFTLVEKDFVRLPAGDLRRFAGSALTASPADYLAVALGCRAFGDGAKRSDAEARAANLVARAHEYFFDPPSGRYCAVPAVLRAGVFFRPLAIAEPLAAESLLILADAAPSAVRRRVLVAAIWALAEEAGDPVPGDVLLALSLAL
jgi:uncharacterized protein